MSYDKHRKLCAASHQGTNVASAVCPFGARQEVGHERRSVLQGRASGGHRRVRACGTQRSLDTGVSGHRSGPAGCHRTPTTSWIFCIPIATLKTNTRRPTTKIPARNATTAILNREVLSARPSGSDRSVSGTWPDGLVGNCTPNSPERFRRGTRHAYRERERPLRVHRSEVTSWVRYSATGNGGRVGSYDAQPSQPP